MHPGSAETTDLTDQILSLEARRVAAMVGKDIAVLETLLADDLSYTHSSGTIDTKASFLERLQAESTRYRYLGVDYVETQVIALNADTVVVRGCAEIRLCEIPAYAVRFLDVWARRQDRWQMVAWQATRIPE